MVGPENSTPSSKVSLGGLGPSGDSSKLPNSTAQTSKCLHNCELHSPAPWFSVAFSSSCAKWEEKNYCTGHMEVPDPELGAQLEENTPLHFANCTEALGFFARVTVTISKTGTLNQDSGALTSTSLRGPKGLTWWCSHLEPQYTVMHIIRSHACGTVEIASGTLWAEASDTWERPSPIATHSSCSLTPWPLEVSQPVAQLPTSCGGGRIHLCAIT